MSIRSAQGITKVFTTRNFSTGTAANGDSTPTGTLYVNGTADAASVTVTNITTGVYKAATTLPTLSVGDIVDLRISATVGGITDNGIIWSDSKDLALDSSYRPGIDWANVGSPTTTVGLTGTTISTSQQVNATQIGSVTQTGGDIFPAITNIAVTSAALNATASSRTITTGTGSGGVANTTTTDSTYDTVSDSSGTLEFYYEFDISGTTGAIGVSVDWLGYVVGAANTIKVYAYNWSGSSWDQVGSIIGIAGTVNQAEVWDLTSAHAGTGGNIGKVRIRFYNTGLVAASVKTDRILLGYVVQPLAAASVPANFSSLSIDSNGRVDVIKIAGTTQTARDIGNSVLLSSGTGTGQVKLSSGYVAPNWGDIGNPTTTVSLTGTTVNTVTTVTNQLTAAQIATGVWQDATAGDFTTTSSIGKSLYTSGVVPGGSGGIIVSGTNTGTTTFGALTITGATTHTGNVSMAAGLTITQSTTNGNGCSITGNGNGSGIQIVGGSSGYGMVVTTAGADGAFFQGGNGGAGLNLTGNNGGAGLALNGGSTGAGLSATGGFVSGQGIQITSSSGDGVAISPTNGNGITITANGASKHGLSITGGTAGTSDGVKAVAGTGGVDIRGNITGNLTGIVSEVTLVDTLTTYTGNTAQTGDSYAIVNSGTFGNAAIKGYVDDIGVAGAGLTALGDTRIAHLDADISSRLASSSYTAPPSAASIATTIWQDLTSGSDFSTSSSIGKLLKDDIDTTISSRLATSGYTTPPTAAAITTTIWTDLLAGSDFSTVASIGKLLKDDIDAAVSSRMATYTQPTGFLATTFPSTVASTTNITAGTITTVTNLTNAPTSGDLTSTMKTSVENAVWNATLASHLTSGTTGAALNTAGSATDPWSTSLPGSYSSGTAGYIVGTNLNATVSSRSTYAGTDTSGTTTLLSRLTSGRATNLDNLDVAISSRLATAGYTTPPTSAAITTAIWTNLLTSSDFSTSASIGKLLKDDIDAAISSRSTFAGGAVSSVTGNVGGNVVGSVGSVAAGVTVTTNNDKTGYSLSVTPPTAATIATAIWHDLTSSSDFTTNSSIGKLLVTDIDATISSRSTYAGIDTSGTTTLLSRLTSGRATNLDNLDAAISTRLATSGYTVPPTSATVASAVWNELLSGHTTAGSTGVALSSASQAGDPWNTTLPGSYSAGSAGYIIGNELDATISSRSTLTAAGVWDLATTGHTTAGTFGRAVTSSTGSGSVQVNEDYGGTGNLAYRTSTGAPIDNAVINIYLKADYDSGNISSDFIIARTNTNVNGGWESSIMLDPAAYTLIYYKQGFYGPNRKDVTVT